MQVTCPACGAKLNISDKPSRGEKYPCPGRSDHEVRVDAVAPTLRLSAMPNAAGPGGKLGSPKKDN
jgi:hypothetical protein